MYYLRTRAAVDPLKGLGIDTTTAKPTVETKEVQSASYNQHNQEEEKMVEMSIPTRPTDSPFECEGCGS